MPRVRRAISAAAAVAAMAACSASPDAPLAITAPASASAVDANAASAARFDCVQSNLARYYAVYHARGVLAGNAPGSTRVFRPYVGDTLSTRPTAVMVSPTKYPAPLPGYNTWNVTGGSAKASGDLFFLLFPQALPGPGGVFPAQLHVWFNGGQWGWVQSSELCTVS